MLTKPFLRISPEKTRRISPGTIIVAYFFSILCLPVLSLVILKLFDGSAYLPHHIGEMLAAIVFSPLFSWIGMVMSLPLIIIAGRAGYWGWGYPFTIGAVIMAIIIVAGLTTRMLGIASGPQREAELPSVGGFLSLLFIGSLFGLAFWFCVRLMNASAFSDD